jgi:hypothetical protein
MRPAFDDNMQLRLRLFWRHLLVLDDARAEHLADAFDGAALRQLWGQWSDLDVEHLDHLAEGFGIDAELYRMPPLTYAA